MGVAKGLAERRLRSCSRAPLPVAIDVLELLFWLGVKPGALAEDSRLVCFDMLRLNAAVSAIAKQCKVGAKREHTMMG